MKNRSLRVLGAGVLVMSLIGLHVRHVQAGTSVSLQTCTVAPSTGGLLGCPSANVMFAPVGPATLVRSAVKGIQGWRAFSTLQPSDSVWTAVGGWQVLSTLSPVLATVPVIAPPASLPPVLPPALPPPPAVPAVPAVQSVTFTSVDSPNVSVTFMQVPVPGCFSVGVKQVCVP